MTRRQSVILSSCALIASGSSIAAQPAAPTDLTASVNGNTVTLQWVAGATPVTSYVVEAGSYFGGSDVGSFDTGSIVRSATAVNVPPGNYWVRVRGRNGTETGSPSNELRVTIATGGQCFETLYPPTGWQASGQGASVVLAWETPLLGCPPTEYVIEAGSTPGGIDLANYRTGSTATTYFATNVPSGRYYVRLRSARNAEVSFLAEERIVFVGTNPCVYSVGSSSIGISRGGSNGSIRISADPQCPWTVSGDVEWLFATTGPLPVSGTGNKSITLSATVNFGQTRTASIAVRWPGGGADVLVTQIGFGLSSF